MQRVIIDTDPGIDDTAAIFLALASPELYVEALTTVYGNGTSADCTRNALSILETAGRSDIPVYQGAGTAGGAASPVQTSTSPSSSRASCWPLMSSTVKSSRKASSRLNCRLRAR